MSRSWMRSLWLAFIAIGLLTACMGGGTDVGNPDFTEVRVTGSLTYKNGQPAAWTVMKLRPKIFLPASDSITPKPVLISRDATTDSHGFFSFDSVKVGEYWVEGNDGHLKGILMELSVDGRSGNVRMAEGQLDTTGSLAGIVTYPGGPGPLKISISTYGMERTTLATSSGQYILSDLPAGVYSLHFSDVNGAFRTMDRTGIILDPGGKMVLDTVRLLSP